MKTIIIFIMLVSSSLAMAGDTSPLTKMLDPLFVCGEGSSSSSDIKASLEKHKLRMLEQLYEVEPDLTPSLVELALTADRISRQQLLFLIELLAAIKTGDSDLALDTIYEQAPIIANQYFIETTETIKTKSFDLNIGLSERDSFITKIRTTIDSTRGINNENNN